MQMFLSKNKRIVVFIAVLLNIIALVSVFTKATDMDESIIAAHSYYLNEVGFVKSPHFHNAGFGWEERQFHYHKLTVWIGSAVSKVFGFHLITFRLISYFYYLAFLLMLFYYLRQKRLHFDFFLLFQIIFLINATVFKFAFIFRPEVAVMTFGFLSYILLEKDKDKSSYLAIVGAGIAAGLAMLIHLNGVVFIMAGTFLLFVSRNFLKGVVFGASGTITSLFYFADCFSSECFANWKTQFFADPNLISKKASPLLKIIEEHMRFFHSEREILFSVLLVLSLLFASKYVRTQFKGLLTYFGLLVVSLAFIAHGTTTKYMLLYMPFMVIIVSLGLDHIKEYKTYQKTLLIISLFTFVTYHGYVNIKLLSKSYNVVERNSMLADKIPEQNTLIYANEGFVFDQISNFEIQSPCAFNFHYSTFFPEHYTAIDDLFAFLYNGGTKYVLIDRYTEEERIYLDIPYEKLRKGSKYFNYTVIDKGEDFILFKK